MKRKNRRKFTAESKARVVLEAARGVRTVYKDEEAADRERARLERKIGQLTMEVEWLAKKSKELGL